MKRFLITISIVTAMCLNANAQLGYSSSSDGFFSTSTQENGRYRNGTEEFFPMLPQTGTHADTSAPLGSGLLLLAGMGVAYGLRKRKK